MVRVGCGVVTDGGDGCGVVTVGSDGCGVVTDGDGCGVVTNSASFFSLADCLTS